MAVIEAAKEAENGTAQASLCPGDASRDGTDRLSEELHTLLRARRTALPRSPQRTGLHLSIDLPT